MFNYIILGFTGSVLAAISQVMLKQGANKDQGALKLAIYLNYYTATGYLLMILVTLINLYVFKYLELKYALIFFPTTFIAVILLSKVIIKERINKRDWITYIIIIIGVVIFNT